jgi:hypothetical protein
MPHEIKPPVATPAPASPQNAESKQTARDIAFGVQQTFACWATDAIDPPLSKFIQNKVFQSGKDVTNAQVWYGEIVGDSAALFEFLAIKKLFRKPIESLTQSVRGMFSGTFERSGHKHLQEWALKEHIKQDDPRYKAALDQYTNFQAHNAVDSTIVATAATLSNVGVQKYLGNPKRFYEILVSKMAGAAITMGLMIGVRTAVPHSAQRLDDELSSRYFSRVTRFLQRVAGVAPGTQGTETDAPEETPTSAKANLVTYGGMGVLGGALSHFAMELEPIERRLGGHPSLGMKAAGAAVGAGAVIGVAHVFTPDSVKMLKQELDDRYFERASKKKGADTSWRERTEDMPLPPSGALKA